jgi:hypothetical protein
MDGSQRIRLRPPTVELDDPWLEYLEPVKEPGDLDAAAPGLRSADHLVVPPGGLG